MEQLKDEVLEDLGKKLLELNSKIGDYLIENKMEIPKNEEEYKNFIENEFENNTGELKKLKKEFAEIRIKMIEHLEIKEYSPLKSLMLITKALKRK